jgi:F5/8 type C domain
MSLGIGQQRKRSTVQSRFRSLVDQIARDRAAQIQIETLDYQGWQRMSSDRLKYNDAFLYGKTKGVRTKFFLPKEPDFNFLTCWLKLDHIGRFIEDASGFNTNGYVKGYPKLKSGIDMGFGGSVYCDFNGTTDFVDVPDSPKVRPSAALSGFSISFRLYPKDISDPNDQKFRKVCCKRDDSNNGFSISVLPEGRLRFTVMVNGLRYSVHSDAGTIIANPLTPVAHDCTVKFLRPTTQANTKLTLLNANISALGFDSPYVVTNVNDANPSTQWVHLALPTWIKVDLGSSKRISRLAIHWYRGATPTNMTFGFTIETSPDNVDWTERLDRDSATAAATGMEYYDITPNVDARYVRVNINENTVDAFASIRDLEVWGSDTPGVPGSAQTQAIYINNVKYTTTTSTHDDLPTDIENELHIARGSTITGTDYKFLGGIQDWRWWKNYLYSDAEVNNLWTNKQTILPIPMGAVAFAGQFVILPESEDFGFDIEGFDPVAILAD